jgi:hypothetical protein
VVAEVGEEAKVPLAWTALPFTPPDTTSALGTTVSSALDGLEHHIMQVSTQFLFLSSMSLTSGVVANITCPMYHVFHLVCTSGLVSLPACDVPLLTCM